MISEQRKWPVILFTTSFRRQFPDAAQIISQGHGRLGEGSGLGNLVGSLPRFSLNGVPRIAEFRRMLELLDLELVVIQWKGYYYMAFTGILESDQRGVTLVSRGSGVMFSFPRDDSKALKSLFRRAWQAPKSPLHGTS